MTIVREPERRTHRPSSRWLGPTLAAGLGKPILVGPNLEYGNLLGGCIPTEGLISGFAFRVERRRSFRPLGGTRSRMSMRPKAQEMPLP